MIPARLGSTRLPNKPLRLLAGEPLIRAVVRNVLDMGLPGELVVATDDDQVIQAVAPLGVTAMLTDRGHRSGTERVHEVARNPQYAAADLIVNIQGDEPFLTADAVRGAVARVERGDDIGTAAQPLTAPARMDPNRVKVEVDAGGRAIRFFRSPVGSGFGPASVDEESRQGGWAGAVLQHIGIYAFTRQALERWMRLPELPLEATKRLEQLRPLAAGMTIGVAALRDPVPPGVDTEGDLRLAEAIR